MVLTIPRVASSLPGELQGPFEEAAHQAPCLLRRCHLGRREVLEDAELDPDSATN